MPPGRQAQSRSELSINSVKKNTFMYTSPETSTSTDI